MDLLVACSSIKNFHMDRNHVDQNKIIEISVGEIISLLNRFKMDYDQKPEMYRLSDEYERRLERFYNHERHCYDLENPEREHLKRLKKKISMTAIEKYKEALDIFTNKKDELFKPVRQEFAKTFADLFAECPKIKSISWTQYTPYFNDGETPEFAAHIDYPDVNSKESLEDTGFLSSKMYRPENYPGIKENLELDWAAFETYLRFIKALQSVPKRLFQDIFGDHVKVTMHSDGCVEVDAYEHDED